MATDPRLAFEKLRLALDEFHAAAVTYRDADAPEVMRYANRLADAYIMYDDSLFTHYGIEAPFDTFDEDDFYDDDLDDVDDDDDFDDDDFDDEEDDFDDDDDDLDDYDEDDEDDEDEEL
ncbi:hypothetical protein [Arcanobacterium phocae]|uniref:hypothetical protein n=1 Tax=Arcanobacterium phocae TaxID=131112 RepID=UPI001C0F38A8|nr:hypothetical protein [Arcanobacterium phocae]